MAVDKLKWRIWEGLTSWRMKLSRAWRALEVRLRRSERWNKEEMTSLGVWLGNGSNWLKGDVEEVMTSWRVYI